MNQSIRIGVITDFERSPRIDSLLTEMDNEMDRVLGTSKNVLFEEVIYEVKSLQEAQKQHIRLSNFCDLLITIGVVSTKGVSLIDDLPKPTIGVGVVDPLLQDMPFRNNGTSGKDNFTYLWFVQDLEKELDHFRRLFPFHHLIILSDEGAHLTVNAQKGRAMLDSLRTHFNASIQIVSVKEDVQSTISEIHDKTDAVYFSTLIGPKHNDIQVIAEALIERGIPTLSGNKNHVDLGVLVARTSGNLRSEGIKRLAIAVDDILSGINAADISVSLDRRKDYFLNLTTARRIGFSPPFELLFTANLIGALNVGTKTYSFQEIAEIAISENLDLKISYQDIDLSELNIGTAKSNLLPSLNMGMIGSQINEERANASINISEQSFSANLALSQIMYSEEVIAAIKISQYLQKAQEYDTKADVLNVLLSTYISYLNVLSAKTNVILRKENLENTKVNLDLARIRVELGSSNNADLYRWESEQANAMQSVVEAQTGLFSAKLQLNVLTANRLEENFEIKDIKLNDELFRAIKDGLIAELINSPEDLKHATDFLVNESFERNPNRKSLDENIHAAQRKYKQDQRLFYVPTVAFQAEVEEVLARGGKGSSVDEVARARGVNELQNNSWFVGFSLNYPIFNGLARQINIQKSKILLEQLNNSKLNLNQTLELGIRTRMLDLLNTNTNLEYSKKSAESARKNFELIQNNYKEGLVNITQLIDAQQSALNAQLRFAVSVYQYIQAYLQLEFSVGFFSMFLSEQEKLDFQNRFIEYLSNR